MPKLPHTAVVDTGFWIALLDDRDQHHHEALAKINLITSMNLIIPWPCLYETLNTRFVKNPLSMKTLHEYVQRPNTELADDTRYREAAYTQTFALAPKRPISLVDVVIRCILDDVNVKKDCVLTFNPRDFEDICRKRQIEMLYHGSFVY